jgi:hypothetical protein
MRPGSAPAQCRGCAHFRNDPAYLEAAFPGLASMSSAYAAVRSDDGLCLRHDRYLSASSSCRDLLAREAATVAA